MATTDTQVAGMDLDQLDAYLNSDRSPPESLMLSCLDGFLAGIAVGPELVMPSEWLPVVWGDPEPAFADGEDAQAAIGGIFSRYNEILREIDLGVFRPIFWMDADGTAIAVDWAEGFLLAIGLRPQAWKPLLQSEREFQILVPILTLCGDENGDPVLDLSRKIEDEACAMAADLVPPSVVKIAEFWKSRRTSDGVQAVDKTGRNCPYNCGSAIVA